ncbi:MAG: energy transducer TonB [Salinivirgaceae bacterium]|nr:energy transducer TonB [Salinivirgaceae bacterium]
MEAKKNPKADLGRFAGLFFEIGLVVAFCAVLGAFSYTVQEKKLADFGSLSDVVDDMDLIPITRPTTVTPPPPPVAPKVAEIINIVEDEADLDDELEIDDVDVDQDTKVILIDRQDDVEVDDDDLPFPMAEVMPQFPGGDAALQKYIASHVQYPEIARENGLQGKVYVRFVINKRGEVEDVSIARGVDAALDKEAMRVVQSLPKWSPGMQHGKAVRVLYTVPINFKLN